MHLVGNVEELYKQCKDIENDNCEILIFGAGFRARCVYQYIKNTFNEHLISFAVSSQREDRILYNRDVVQISKKKNNTKVIVFVATDVKYQKSICNKLHEFDYKDIITINFDSDNWNQGADKLFEGTDVYKALQDDESRMQYIGGMMFRFTRNWKYLFDIQRKTITSKYLNTYEKKYLSQFLANLNHKDCRKIIIYGFNSMTKEITLPRLTEVGVHIDAICTNVDKYYDLIYQGIPIFSVEKAIEFSPDGFYILGYHWYTENEVEYLMQKGIKKEKIIYPCSSLTPFSYGMQYFDLQNFICNETGEVFIDAGCLNCDSIFDFLKWSNGKYKRIYAFEPDKENYDSCVSIIREKKIENCEIINAGLWSENTTLNFNACNFALSKVTENGSSQIEAVSLDECLGNEKVTFIKMDIEGSEFEALLGAKKIIMRDKPKLAISIYHKTDDFLDIPDLILEFVPEYKLDIRHYSCYKFETVLYAYV